MVVGSGSSGSQIAQEIMLSGKKVYLSIGPHNRPLEGIEEKTMYGGLEP